MAYSPPPLRLFVPGDLAAGAEIELSPDQARYVAQVMRRTPDDPVHLFNGRDGEWRGTLAQLSRKAATVTLVGQARPQEEEPDLTLLFAPVKRAATDLIVQKSTELGVRHLQPVMTHRTNSDRVRTDRLASIAMEAAEQCGRMIVPQVHEPVSLPDAFASWPEDRILFVMDETGTGDPIADVMAEDRAQSAASAAFVIGPEGGFADSELDLLRALPFSKFVSLGPRVLRADTAALAAITCWQALCGDWRQLPHR